MNAPLAPALAAAFLLSLATAASADDKAPAAAALPAPGVVDIAAARRLVAQGVKVVDVRTAAEFAAGHVPGAVNIPFDEMERRHAEVGPASTPVVIYCRTGRRSGAARQVLRAKGFTQVFDFQSYDLWVRSEK
jgi:rhodanese-related sulfurtransferase